MASVELRGERLCACFESCCRIVQTLDADFRLDFEAGTDFAAWCLQPICEIDLTTVGSEAS